MSTIVPIGADGPEFERAAYTPAMRVGELVFVSGQVAMTDDGQTLAVGDFKAQGDIAFQRLSEVLRKSGSDLSQVVKVTIFLTDRDFFPDLVELRKKWFSAPYPADSTVVVKSLVREECLIEIEAVALVSSADVGE